MNRLASLKAELRAIELWDEIYSQEKFRDEIDEISHQAREDRWWEIRREIGLLRSGSPSVFDS
jgi:hypothetical protein